MLLQDIQLLEFLQVPYEPTGDPRRLNSNKRHRYMWLGKLLAHDSNTFASKLVRRFDRLPGIKRLHLKYRLHEFNKIEYKRQPLPPELRSMLIDEFRDDVALLSELTNRNLDHWLEMPAKK